MSAALTCGSCGEPLAAGSHWGLWKCQQRACPEYGREITIKPKQTTFQRKKWYQTRKRTA